MQQIFSRKFLKQVMPYFGIFSVLLLVLLVFQANSVDITSPDFVAKLRLPEGGKGGFAGEILKGKLLGEKGGLSAVHYFVFGKGYSVVTQIIGAVAVLSLVYFGIQMVVANSKEETISQAKHSILMIFIGLAIVAMADTIVDQVFVLSGGTFVGDQEVSIGGKTLTVMEKSVGRFNYQVGIIVTFLRYIIQGIAFFFIVRSGLALIIGGQESDVLDKQKKVFMWGIVALILIMAADTVITEVIFPVEFGKKLIIGGDQIEVGKSVISQIINMILAFSGGVAVFSLVVGAAMYATALGHEESTEKGKNIVIGSLMGMVIIFSAYTIVAEFIK